MKKKILRFSVKVGDLVKYKVRCIPPNMPEAGGRVYLVSALCGGFIRVHNINGLIAKANFDLVRSTNENR